MKIESTTLDIDDNRIYVEVSGKGEPILLLNGLGGDPTNLEKIRSYLNDRQVIIYDPPGVGKSSDLKFPIRLSSHANIAMKVLDKLSIEETSVLGVSWGGALAQEIAYNNPTIVSKLILVSTMPGPFLITSPSMIFNRYIKTLLGSKTELLQIASILGWTSLPYLTKIKQPTLIVTGNKDDLVLPYNAHLLKRLIPNSEIKILDDMDHWLIVDGADQLSDLVKSFMDS